MTGRSRKIRHAVAALAGSTILWGCAPEARHTPADLGQVFPLSGSDCVVEPRAPDAGRGIVRHVEVRCALSSPGEDGAQRGTTARLVALPRIDATFDPKALGPDGFGRLVSLIDIDVTCNAPETQGASGSSRLTAGCISRGSAPRGRGQDGAGFGLACLGEPEEPLNRTPSGLPRCDLDAFVEPLPNGPGEPGLMLVGYRYTRRDLPAGVLDRAVAMLSEPGMAVKPPHASQLFGDAAALSNQLGDYLRAERSFERTRQTVPGGATMEDMNLSLQRAVNRSSMGHFQRADEDFRHASSMIWTQLAEDKPKQFRCDQYSNRKPDRTSDLLLVGRYFQACAHHLANRATEPKAPEPGTKTKRESTQAECDGAVEQLPPDLGNAEALTAVCRAADKAQEYYVGSVCNDDRDLVNNAILDCDQKRLPEGFKGVGHLRAPVDSGAVVSLSRPSLLALFGIADLHDLRAQVLASIGPDHLASAIAQLRGGERLLASIGLRDHIANVRMRQTESRMARVLDASGDAITPLRRSAAFFGAWGTEPEDAPHNRAYGQSMLDLGGAYRSAGRPAAADASFGRAFAILKEAVEDDRPGLDADLVMPYLNHLYDRLSALGRAGPGFVRVDRPGSAAWTAFDDLLKAMQLIDTDDPRRLYPDQIRDRILRVTPEPTRMQVASHIRSLAQAEESLQAMDLVVLRQPVGSDAPLERAEWRDRYKTIRTDLRKALPGTRLSAPRIVGLSDIQDALKPTPDEAVWIIALGRSNGYGLVISADEALVYPIGSPQDGMESLLVKFHGIVEKLTGLGPDSLAPYTGNASWTSKTDVELEDALKEISQRILYPRPPTENAAMAKGNTLFAVLREAICHINVVKIGAAETIPINVLKSQSLRRQESCKNHPDKIDVEGPHASQLKSVGYLIEAFSVLHYVNLSEFARVRALPRSSTANADSRYALFGAPARPSMEVLANLDGLLRNSACAPYDVQAYSSSDTVTIAGLYRDQPKLQANAENHAICLNNILNSGTKPGLPARKVALSVGRDFTIDAALQPQNASIVEFYTHGVLGGDMGCLGTAGILAFPQRPTKTSPSNLRDFFITPERVAQEFVTSGSVVMMQACDSAESNPLKVGDRSMPLTSAVLLADVPAVVAAEWPIDNTIALYVSQSMARAKMTRQHRLNSSGSLARHTSETLRLAQLQLLHRKTKPDGDNANGGARCIPIPNLDSAIKLTRNCCLDLSARRSNDAIYWGAFAVHGGQ